MEDISETLRGRELLAMPTDGFHRSGVAVDVPHGVRLSDELGIDKVPGDLQADLAIADDGLGASKSGVVVAIIAVRTARFSMR